VAGVDAVILSGRCHYYEGYSAEQVVFGVRALGRFGVKTMIFTNAAGGNQPQLISRAVWS
jgi:purine-nucleoside phosphorylase